MQLHALDSTGSRIHVSAALTGHDYSCMECGASVRRRGGEELRAHFYHYRSNEACRQHAKTIYHLATQQYLLQCLKGAEQEVAFPEIGRIADVAWPHKRLIFEVQYSPITAEEVRARSTAYTSIGWGIIWLLHDRRYGRRRLAPAEEELLGQTHYYTNIGPHGGTIYDAWHPIVRGRRKRGEVRRQIALEAIYERQPCVREGMPFPLGLRWSHWQHSCEGDLLWAIEHNELLVETPSTKPSRSWFVRGLRNLWDHCHYALAEYACSAW